MNGLKRYYAKQNRQRVIWHDFILCGIWKTKQRNKQSILTNLTKSNRCREQTGGCQMRSDRREKKQVREIKRYKIPTAK